MVLKLLGPIDDKGPMLYSAEAFTKSTIFAEFSESLDSASVTHNAFIISDSSHIKNVAVKTAFLQNGTNNQVKIITEYPLDTISQWQLQVVSKGEFALKDSSGNLIQDTVSSAYFYAVPDKDTNDLKLLMTIPSDSSENIKTGIYLDFIFNNSIIEKKDGINSRLVCTNDDKEINYKTVYPLENILRIIPDKLLESVREYRCEIKHLFDDSDSLFALVFKTADERNYGGIAGTIEDSSEYKGYYLITLYSVESDDTYNYLSKDGKWEFNHLPPGDYKMEISSDKNKNGKYDSGYPFPWQPAEKFYQLPGTLHIKARWSVKDFKINYKGQ